MSDYKVVIVDNRYDCYEQENRVLAEANADVIVEKSTDDDKIMASTKDADGVIVNLAPITAKIISSMNRCRCVSRYGVGYDNIDVKAMKDKGICLANVPDYCDEDVSDQAIALLLDCIRKISRKDHQIRNGKWNLTGIQPVYRICSKVLGFVGYGNIAKCLRRKLTGFNLSRILIYDPYLSDEDIQKTGAVRADIETLCRESDYISIHAPLVASTRGMFNRKCFDLMKRSAILINTSRGPIVDENDLIDALKKGRIACAGLDVFTQEPIEQDNELKQLGNVVLTDHAGWYSEESMIELKTKAALNIADVLNGKKPRYLVEL